MAVIYTRTLGDTQYEVRTAGQTVRLYSNGVLHSQFNPNHVISGAIWDLLLLPIFLKPTPPKNVLLLGLGGGTLVHTIKTFFPSAVITCVELDKQHIQIAKRFFNIPKQSVEIHHGDAYEFLRRTPEKYDWIIDDVFQHVTGEPERSSDQYQTHRLYKRCLNKDGLLSLNLIGKRQLENIQPMMANWQQVYQFTHPLYENRIVAMGNQIHSKIGFKKALIEFPELNQNRKTCRLKYAMRLMK